MAFVIHHDGVGLSAQDAAGAQVGDDVRIRGTPNTQAAVALRPLASLLPPLEASRFANATGHTAVVDAGDVVLWLVSSEPIPTGSVVLEGTVIARTRTSESAPRPVVAIHVEDWTRPLLFR